MRNRKIYRHLETIIETSLSPKHRKIGTTRILCGPNVTLPPMSKFGSLASSPDILQKQRNHMKIGDKGKSMIEPIQKKKYILHQLSQKNQISSPLQLTLPKNNPQFDNQPQQMLARLSKVCIALATKEDKRKMLEIVYLHSKGNTKTAVSKLIQWILAWVANLFQVFSKIMRNLVSSTP